MADGCQGCLEGFIDCTQTRGRVLKYLLEVLQLAVKIFYYFVHQLSHYSMSIYMIPDALIM